MSTRQEKLNTSRVYWKRAHRDWRFWVFFVLMLTGIIVYVMSDDFAFFPHNVGQRPHHRGI
jgi:hypothetical protein